MDEFFCAAAAPPGTAGKRRFGPADALFGKSAERSGTFRLHGVGTGAAKRRRPRAVWEGRRGPCRMEGRPPPPVCGRNLFRLRTISNLGRCHLRRRRGSQPGGWFEAGRHGSEQGTAGCDEASACFVPAEPSGGSMLSTAREVRVPAGCIPRLPKASRGVEQGRGPWTPSLRAGAPRKLRPLRSGSLELVGMR